MYHKSKFEYIYIKSSIGLIFVKRGLCKISFQDNNGTIVNSFKNGLQSYLTGEKKIKVFHRYNYKIYESIVIITVFVKIINYGETPSIKNYKCNIPKGVEFVRGSVSVNGVSRKGGNVESGILLPSLNINESCLIQYILMKKVKS